MRGDGVDRAPRIRTGSLENVLSLQFFPTLNVSDSVKK